MLIKKYCYRFNIGFRRTIPGITLFHKLLHLHDWKDNGKHNKGHHTAHDARHAEQHPPVLVDEAVAQAQQRNQDQNGEPGETFHVQVRQRARAMTNKTTPTPRIRM